MSTFKRFILIPAEDVSHVLGYMSDAAEECYRSDPKECERIDRIGKILQAKPAQVTLQLDGIDVYSLHAALESYIAGLDDEDDPNGFYQEFEGIRKKIYGQWEQQDPQLIEMRTRHDKKAYNPQYLGWCESYEQEVKELREMIEGGPGDVKMLKQEYKNLTGKQYRRTK